MIKAIARILSVVLHPILMPSYALMLLVFGTRYGELFSVIGKYFLFLIVGVLTVVLPVMFILFLRGIGRIRSLHLSERRERVAPLLFAVISCYVNGVVFSYIKTIPLVFSHILVVISFLLLLLAMITKFWKVSLHLAGIGGLVALSYFLLGGSVIFPISVLLAGVLGTVRLYLQKHTPMQVYAGFFLGIFAVSVYFLFVI